MDLGEMVATAADAANEDCPFEHIKVMYNEENEMNNSSSKLRVSLNTESNAGTELILPHFYKTTIGTGESGRKNHKMTYNPHHIFPGDESWPDTALLKWITKGENIKGDIGYDVNGCTNDIDLPSSSAMKLKWKERNDFQVNYAIAAMESDGKGRQFHDRHISYSDFAKEVLDKIAAKFDVPSRSMGCDDDDCSAGKKKPFVPPYLLIPRIRSSAERIVKTVWASKILEETRDDIKF